MRAAFGAMAAAAALVGGGCAIEPGGGVDARAPIAEVDAAVVGPAGEAVATVYGRIGGLPVVDVDVIFLEADGTVAAVTRTDAAGRARGTVHAGASVTAIYGDVLSSAPTLYTVLGVAPGDDLTLGTRAEPWPLGGRVEVVFAAHPAADRYRVTTSCGGGETRVAPVTVAYCADDPHELVVHALRGADTVAIVAAGDLPFADGARLDVGGAWQPLLPFTLELTGVPAGLRRVDAAWLSSAGGNHHAFREAPPPAAALATGRSPATQASLEVALQRGDGAVQLVMAPLPATAASQAMDLSDAPLAWIGPVELDLATGRALVPVDAGAAGDLFYLRAGYRRGRASYAWEIISGRPGDTRLPTLPPPFDLVNPRPDDLPESHDAWIIDVHDAASYDDVRDRAFPEAYRAMNAVTRRQERPLRISRSVLP